MPENKEEWVERVHALARTQAQYVWILLVAGLFYSSLSRGVCASGQTPSIREVPFFLVSLDAQLILLSAPLVLSFLILAFAGSVRAFKHATDAVLENQSAKPWAAEKLDVCPNAIDMAVYTTSKTPQWICNIVYFAYPAYLTAFLLESAWLWYVCIPPGACGLATILFSTLSVLIWIPACWQVILGWRRRFQMVRQGKHIRDTS